MEEQRVQYEITINKLQEDLKKANSSILGLDGENLQL
jgi:hypothetical protein